MANKIPPLLLENVRIFRGGFRNFAGTEGRFNAAGNRHFGIGLDPEIAEQMKRDGWNVKYLDPQDEGDVPVPWLDVVVSYKGFPPRVTLITSRGRTQLDEHTIDTLDYADIRLADLTLNPYVWEVNGKSGIKAYLKSLYVTIEEDELDLKYSVVDSRPEDY